NGNFIAKWGTYGTGDGQFDLLRGIAVDQGGFVYAIDLYRIQKFDSNGNFITKWGSYSYSCDNPGGFVDPNGIAVGNDGYVYVKDAHCGAIQKFDGNGAFITKWGSEGEGDGQFSWDGSSRGNNIVVGPDGYVYASDYWNHRIQKFDSNGAFAAKWGTLGFDPGEFYTPRALTFDTQGNLYVTEDFGNAGIQKFDSNGTFLVMWQNEGEVRQPYAITLTRDGSVLIGGPSYVKKYDRDGAFLETLVEDLNYFFPRGIATGPDGSVYAISHYFSEIRKISGEGDFYIGPGTGDGQVQYPWGLVSAADGSIYIADTDNNRIQQVDRNGTFLRKWGSQGSGDGQFEFPKGIAVAPDGAVYVADTLNNRIQKFDGNGNFITKWGSQGYADGQFVEPVAVASGLDGSVFVASDSRVQSFDSQGVFIKRWGRVPEIGLSFAFTVFGEGGSTGMSGEINFNSPSGIAIGPEGSVYVADTGNNHIQKLGNSSVETFFTATIPIIQPANTTHGYTNDIGALGSTGKFFLEATLTNSLGQRLGRSTYPFYVVPENMFAIFSTDKAMYRPGETVTIQGEVRNLSSVAANGVSIVMTRESAAGSETLYDAAFDVPANGAYPFTITTSAGPEGTFMLTGTITHLSAAVFEATVRYEVTTPKASATVTGPDAAGSDPFTLTFAITNEGKIDIAVVLTSPFDSQTLSIPAGESRILVYPPQQITQDTTYTFTLSGDVNMAVSKTVGYGLAASLTANVLPMYPEGNVAIPLSVNNGGSLDGSFTVDVLLQPSGLSSQRNYAIPHGQTISDTLLFNLAEGDYTLSLASQSPPTSTSVSFFVRKETKATMAAITMGAPVGGLIPVSTEVVNGGAVDIEGTAQMSIVDTQAAVVWQANQAMSIPASSTPTPAPVSFSFSPAALLPGAYTVMVALLNNGGQELASRNMPLTITGSNVRLTQMPSFQTVNAGEEATFIFKVANTGGRDGSAELTLKSGDFINLTRRELINPGEEKEFPFAFPIPYDLETKDYFAEYELKSEGVSIAKGQVRYHVAGINISVTASLDKDHYREGETAHLNLIVSQQGGVSSQNLFARVNHGGYESKQDFSLTGSQNLSFGVPLTVITGEKLFYGVYEEGGRSIHLNSLYIYKTGDVFTITTNKQVYSQGETVVAVVTGTSTGTLALSAPGGYEETFPFNGSISRSFALPRIAVAGTYFIEAQLTLPTGETVTANKPFDIAGISVKVKEALLDKGKYMPGDTLRLSMRIESNSDMPADLKVWTVDPDKNSTFLGERQLSLARAEQVLVSTDYPSTITTSGIYKVIYGIYSDRLLLSSGNLSFDAGDGVILGIVTDRNEYPLGSETVAVRLNLYGTTEATLTLNVNGAAVHTEALSLNGFTTPAIQLPIPGPGAHTLEGILAAGGLSSTKETKFLYGTNLPDLTADVWGSGTAIGKDGRLKLTASAGNRGKTATTQTLLTLHDGDILLATFPVGELAAGSSQSHEFLWNVLGKAGEHTLAATVDPQNALTEFTKENNRVTRRIVVPDIALITETDKESYRTGEQVTVNATTINLTAATNYPNLTCTTIVRNPVGAEVYRQSSAFSLPLSQSALVSATWNTGSVATEGRYIIRQEIASGTALLAERTKTVSITVGTGFGLRVDPAILRIKQGETALFTVSVDTFTGWNGSVNLEAEGIPTGTTAV
ncbi:MAG: hypothetical protein E4H15_02070, partial [Syntrophobacterales bacterium]